MNASKSIRKFLLRKFSCDLSIFRLQRNSNISTFVFDPLLKLPNLTTTRVPIDVTFISQNWYFGDEMLFCFHIVIMCKKLCDENSYLIESVIQACNKI